MNTSSQLAVTCMRRYGTERSKANRLEGTDSIKGNRAGQGDGAGQGNRADLGVAAGHRLCR